MKNKFGVIIGRFQPLHDAHLRIIREALTECQNVIILVGSANRSRTFKNPLTFTERRALINNALRENGFTESEHNVRIEPIDDHPYNDAAWVTGVHNRVDEVIESIGLQNVEPHITVYGHKKDNTAYYLDLFPKWHAKKMPSFGDIHAVGIRENLYKGEELTDVPPNVKASMEKFISSDEGIAVKNEYHFIKKYKDQFSSLPYPPIFSTTDAVVYYKGYVLMVVRKGYPGKGQWALPGGFLEHDMPIKDSMVKEVKEETCIRISRSILFGNLRKIEVFDDPSRSLRGRTVTHCGLIVLDPVTSIQTLPYVKGNDDAQHAAWISLNEIESMKGNIFEDHYFIIKQMLNMT